jgi:succinate dehydrogenase / fumarate reductase iron-sulfur subunit
VHVQIRVQKFNPESDPAPHFQSYGVEAPPGMTLLSALLKIKAEIDGTLTFRASCRAAICGSCLMQVNGIQKLACRVSLREEMARHRQVVVGPMENMPLIKDLVVRMDAFWEKIRAITPYILPAEREAPPPDMRGLQEALHNADGCIMCAACLSACQSFSVSPGFLGPAALAKAYRFQADPREGSGRARLETLQGDGGIWDCVRCNFCVSVCPKEVAPMEQIVRLRRLSIASGLTDTIGARHITQFTEVVGEEGRLNETKLPIRMTWGKMRAMLRIVPAGLKMFWHGKVPFPFSGGASREIRALFSRRRPPP